MKNRAIKCPQCPEPAYYRKRRDGTLTDSEMVYACANGHETDAPDRPDTEKSLTDR